MPKKAVNNSDQTLDVEAIRQDFPILHQQLAGQSLVYLDNAATTQKPNIVLSAIDKYYRQDNANIHRGVHTLSERATDSYEQAREKVRIFTNAESTKEIIFTRGTTEGINLIAQSYGRTKLVEGDEIIITEMEHHSNIVPWQLLCEQIGTVLKVIPINDAGELIVQEYQNLLGPRTKIVSLVHISNALGTINPIQHIIEYAHQNDAITIVDGAQAAAHNVIDVQQLNCDFYVFSGHKVFAPTGVGVVYGKQKLLESMPPWQGGGDMIQKVSFAETLYNDIPYKFEAGTPHIAGVIGLGYALDYLKAIGADIVVNYEQQLLNYATSEISKISGLHIVGQAKKKASILGFVMDGVHPHDIGTVLNHQGIAIRTGHHCAMPVMERFGVVATARASFAFYNTFEEIDKLVQAVQKTREMFS